MSHDRAAETMEAKAKWFQSLTLAERMDLLCMFTDLALAINPETRDKNRAQPVPGRIQVLTPPRRLAPTAQNRKPAQ